ncbi:hypothetical protein FN846DRAFT_570393 [Sphaerosporella brunnea]|uniref:Uncharacterized protein n=1 Tax=Sphaerosporella brunnea TaxID=1250544 RepID=A0A5J5F2V5_9PEZI|nr:hypothetical protein FN846DRAFT_570393 [Sphaerosporella brunnea]
MTKPGCPFFFCFLTVSFCHFSLSHLVFLRAIFSSIILVFHLLALLFCFCCGLRNAGAFGKMTVVRIRLLFFYLAPDKAYTPFDHWTLLLYTAVRVVMRCRQPCRWVSHGSGKVQGQITVKPSTFPGCLESVCFITHIVTHMIQVWRVAALCP